MGSEDICPFTSLSVKDFSGQAPEEPCPPPDPTPISPFSKGRGQVPLPLLSRRQFPEVRQAENDPFSQVTKGWDQALQVVKYKTKQNCDISSTVNFSFFGPSKGEEEGHKATNHCVACWNFNAERPQHTWDHY